ncbi:transcriptional antiterminator RfaH [Prosthecobacter debontii]|uniref:Transcriptional antiterminator RfaH n=1 Tax=Prosthecobacter debontii TaxID=48467 RepID=A0A1T4XC32_9BACT|nr:transcription termination/antitermination NusG family protein [Prosthecobacter debontii]SKA86708.1 transcriptional antiterminator RfaH [Prosthecobacter debontii]
MRPDEPAWYVIHTKPKCEHLAAALMRGLPGVETFCPRIRFQRSTRRGKVWFVEALFPSYFFARFIPLNSQRAVKHSQNVIRIVDFGGQMVSVPDSVIESVRSEMDHLEVKEVKAGLHVGDTVELTEGPMRGLKGIVNSIHDGQDRVKILMEFLGRQSLIEVESSKVLPEQTPREILAGS